MVIKALQKDIWNSQQHLFLDTKSILLCIIHRHRCQKLLSTEEIVPIKNKQLTVITQQFSMLWNPIFLFCVGLEADVQEADVV